MCGSYNPDETLADTEWYEKGRGVAHAIQDGDQTVELLNDLLLPIVVQEAERGEPQSVAWLRGYEEVVNA